jgi:hypothetical protein
LEVRSKLEELGEVADAVVSGDNRTSEYNLVAGELPLRLLRVGHIEQTILANL